MLALSRMLCGLLFLAVAVCVATAAEPESKFPLKDGDVWVMAGDSITAQHLHSNYFEAFCYARYPKLKFAFRNSGVGGHTIPSTLARFDYDIAAWKPTVVSVELGMNDRGGTTVDKFVANMKTMVDRIRGINARPVILSASPDNNGELVGKLGGGNQRLHDYALALKPFAEGEKIPYADQFHALNDVWARQWPRVAASSRIGELQRIAADDSVAGVEHLRAYIEAQSKVTERPISMQGDSVHPGPNGQLMMAAALLKDLGADPFVSSVTIGADGKVAEAKGCQVEGVSTADGALAFDRTDERLPFPIPDDARAVLAFDPTIEALSQYTLKVTGLKAGNYVLKLNGSPAAELSAEALAAGVNLTNLPAPKGGSGNSGMNPIAAQARAILGAVANKENIVGQWRGLSQRAHAKDADPQLMKDLAALTPKVEEADAKIREAAKPAKLHFEIVPAK